MDETFRTFHRALSLAGIPFFAEFQWDSKIWLTLQIFNVFIALLTFIFTSGFVIEHFSDLELMIQGACVWSTGLLMLISFGICLQFRGKFRSFLNEMGFRDGMVEMPLIGHVLGLERGTKLYELKTMVNGSQERLLTMVRVLLKAYMGSVFFCVTLYLLNPVYIMIVSEDETLRILAFDMWFPWSLENFKVYVASFVFHAYAGYMCCVAHPGLQCTIFLLVGQVIRQLKLLTHILLNLNELVEEMVQNNPEEQQKYCTIVLSQCVDHYVKLKRFSKKLNIICSPFYLALIIDAIMLVCMCSVKIAISDKLTFDTMKYYVHECCYIIMVLLFCLLGQQVENECEKLEKSITEKWYIFDQRHKKNVLILHMALSQRMPIYIFGTITLSLPTFTWFINTGLSFFTLMMSVLD